LGFVAPPAWFATVLIGKFTVAMAITTGIGVIGTGATITHLIHTACTEPWKDGLQAKQLLPEDSDSDDSTHLPDSPEEQPAVLLTPYDTLKDMTSRKATPTSTPSPATQKAVLSGMSSRPGVKYAQSEESFFGISPQPEAQVLAELQRTEVVGGLPDPTMESSPITPLKPRRLSFSMTTSTAAGS